MAAKLALVTTLALASLAAPTAAWANDFQRIFGDYKADGDLDGCYRAEELHNAGREIPPDVEQYAPGFGNALSSAQVRCSSAAPPPAEPEPEPLSAGTPGPGAPPSIMKKTVKEPPAPKPVEAAVVANLAQPELTPATARVAAETPGALIALLIAAGIALLLALAWTLAWFMGWSPERLTKPLFAAFQSVWDRRSDRRAL
jgi:hypothetical protein